MKINHNEFIKAVKQACNYTASAKSWKPALKNLHLYTDGGKLIIEATDSYKIFKAAVNCEYNENENFNFIVKPFTFPKSWKIEKQNGALLDFNPETRQLYNAFTDETIILNLDTESATYPETARIYNLRSEQGNAAAACFKVENLKAILKDLKPDDIIQIGLNSDIKPALIKTASPDDCSNGYLYNNATILLSPVKAYL